VPSSLSPSLTSLGDPIVAVATAPGRGGVGIVRVSGAALAPLAQALVGRTPAPRVATYTGFLDAQGEPIDQGLALYFAAPHSYTGEDVLELQAHGGPVLLQLLLARCVEAAAETDPRTGRPRLPRLRLAQPGEFTQRAFLNGKLDLAQAEAVADLIDAGTEAAARSAGRSLAGAFSREVDALATGLLELRTLVEATLDFPEEEMRAAARAARLQQARRASRVRRAAARRRAGAVRAHRRRPARAASRPARTRGLACQPRGRVHRPHAPRARAGAGARAPRPRRPIAAQGDAALDLLAEELRLAHDALGEITGRVTPDALLGEIFGRFCIGK
jgi:tRNA U34 5-carboxymethylaminomethyl modifying GTPase MnmE/TrmE